MFWNDLWGGFFEAGDVFRRLLGDSAKLKALRNKRNGVDIREMNDMKKSVSKSLFKKYAMLKNMDVNIPIPKPTDLLDDPEKHKQEIQMFASGLIQITKNPQVDGLICEYFKEVSETVGYDILSREEVEKMLGTQQPAVEKEAVPPSIDLNSYVDSDTESESSDEDSE